MNQFEPKIAERYLHNEMSEEEREQFENTMLGDDDMFYDIAAREDELVDLYSAGKLADGQRERFQRSLAGNPARRQKIANAKVLTGFFSSERASNKTITIAERSGLFEKLAELFSFRSPVFQFAAVGLIAVLALASIFLLVENRRLGSLQQELAGSRLRENELASQIESERETAADLVADLDAERGRIQKLEAEIERLGTSGTTVRPPSNIAPPTIATLILSPGGIRGGPALVRRVDLPSAATRLSIVLTLPAQTGERVSLKLNGETVAENRRVGSRNGEKIVSITIPVSRIKDGRNEIDVFDSSGTKVEDYVFSVSRQK